MTAESDHKKTAHIRADDIGTGRKVDLIDDVVHPDYAGYGPTGGIVKGRDGYRALVGAFHSAFPNLQSKVKVMIAEGEYVSLRFHVTGVNDGGFLGLAPTGKSVDFDGLINLRFADGLIIEQYELFDWPTMMQRLGLEPVFVPHFEYLTKAHAHFESAHALGADGQDHQHQVL